MEAILYLSYAGHTQRYAEILGEKLGLPVYPLKKAPLKRGAEVIFLGWVMACSLKGYKKAAKKYNVKAVCPVGMTPDNSQLETIRVTNHIPEDVPTFVLQGGLELDKLKGFYKMMLKMVKNILEKKLKDTSEMSKEDETMLNLLLNGGDFVSAENLQPVIDWYNNH